MASRRAVLKGGFAAATTALLAGRSGPAQTVPLQFHRPDQLIVDSGSPLSGTLVEHARRNAVPCLVGKGDITSLWFEVLEPLWRNRPATVAGETRLEAIFCLERLAADYGMRMEYRADRLAGNFGTELRIRARQDALDRTLSALSKASEHPHVQATCLLRCPVAEGPVAVHTLRSSRPAPDLHWVSWVIAPRSRD